jgi:hypothetical protein
MRGALRHGPRADHPEADTAIAVSVTFPAEQPRFIGLPSLRWRGLAGPVELVAPLVFVSSSGRVFTAPAGLVSDLESRPTWHRA